jgi:hypothetical protein
MPSTPIPYNRRSILLPECLLFVQQHRATILSGSKILWQTVWRGARGGDFYVIIEAGTHFHSTYFNIDWTHFPARLRALATALRDENCFYYFHLAYNKITGVVTIQRLDRPIGSGSKSAGPGKPNSSGSNASPSQIRIPKIKKKGDWWDAFKGTIEKAIAGGMPVGKLTFRGGGTVPIPDWFRDWCQQNGIEIEILDPEQFDEPQDEAIHIEQQPD